MSKARRSRRRLAAAAGALAAACLALPTHEARADEASLAFAPTYLPSYAGLGVGFAPDYIGSNDYRFGAAPVARWSRGHRSADLIANFARVNLLDHPNWRIGPAGTLRLRRGDVADPVVDRLPSIGATVELGGFVAYSVDVGDDPRQRFAASASVTQDVLGEHEGFVAALSVRKWLPVGRFGALGLALGTSYASADYTDTYYSVTPAGAAASGLRLFEAGAGMRDVRATAVFVQPLSKTFVVGVGALYGRMLGDAADSPIVAERGSRDQFIVGVGAGFLFW